MIQMTRHQFVHVVVVVDGSFFYRSLEGLLNSGCLAVKALGVGLLFIWLFDWRVLRV